VQDWGSLIGLKVAGENPDLFATIAVGDGALLPVPEGTELFPPVENPNELTDIPSPFDAMPAQQVPFYDGCEPILGLGEGYFGDWMAYAMTAESFHASEVVEAMTWYDLSPQEEAAYDAPFPSREYMAGPRVFPSLANQLGGNTIEAWNGLTSFDKPFLTLWASNDPGNLGSCETQQQLIDNVPGAAGQPHDRLPEASHFLQDDQGTEIATRLVDWYGNLDEEPAGTAQGEERVGYELLEIQDDGTIWAWIAYDMTQEEFDALELPSGWLKNQPREGVPDSAQFYGSPAADGVLVEEEHFGFEWFHSATITNLRVDLDNTGLLNATTVEKDHEIGFDPGSTLSLLVAPNGDSYVMVSRDAGRSTDDPTVPEGWAIVELVVSDGFTARLDGETTVIRMDNEDSYQGPVTGLDMAASSPLGAAGASGSRGGDEAVDGGAASGNGLGAEAGEANLDELEALLSTTSAEDDAFYMVNLIRFREMAEYPDGRETDLTGQEADAIYGEFVSSTMLPEIGAEIVYSASVPPGEGYDTVAIVRYPSRVAFQRMIDDPKFQEMSIHKQAGVADTIVLATDLVGAEDVASGEAVLYLVGADDAGTAVPGERAVFEVLATINGATDTFEEVRIGTAGTETIVTVTHRVLVDGLTTAE
jgi:pimeloyl-ACP methyl ester carboxylesterase